MEGKKISFVVILLMVLCCKICYGQDQCNGHAFVCNSSATFFDCENSTGVYRIINSSFIQTCPNDTVCSNNNDTQCSGTLNVTTTKRPITTKKPAQNATTTKKRPGQNATTTTKKPAQNITTTTRKPSQNGTVCRRVGRFANTADRTCRTYHLCVRNRRGGFVRTTYKCASGTSFNSRGNCCDRNHKCARALPAPAVCPKNPIFPAYPDPSVPNCRGYITCKHTHNHHRDIITTTRYNCLPPKIFSPIVHRCVPIPFYVCPRP